MQAANVGLWKTSAILSLIALIGLIFFTDSADGAKIISVFMIAVVCVGFGVGGYLLSINNDWLERCCSITANQHVRIMTAANADHYRGYDRSKEEDFILKSFILMVCYVSFFFYCMAALRGDTGSSEAIGNTLSAVSVAATDGNDPAIGGFPVQMIPVGIITSIVLGVMAFHVARYAAFVQRLSILAVSIERDAEISSDPVLLALRKQWRVNVFEWDQVYEPPGNIFVTLGIMSTFLGLAFGLATTSFFKQVPEGDKIVDSLQALVGCMSIGLGVSMIGVAIAMLSQALRGHGPCLSTNDILAKPV